MIDFRRFAETVLPISVTNNSVCSRTAAVGYVGAAIVDHVAGNGRSRTDAVICNWKGLKPSNDGSALGSHPTII